MVAESQTWRWFAISVLLAGSMWSYVFQIWGAGQFAQFSDLYAPWWATHEIMLHHRDPYSPQVAHEIQIFVYGTPSQAAFPGDPEEIAGGFAYPIHATYFLIPTIWLQFSTVHVLILWIFLALSIASILLWLGAVDWRPSPLATITIVLFGLGCFPVVQALKLRNLTVLAAFLIASAVAALTRERFVAAGILLAAATLKPQFVVLLLPWLAMWITGDWKRRRPFAISFLISIFILLSAGELLLPGWVYKFLRILNAYHQYTYSHSLLDLWLPRPWSWLAAGTVVGFAGVQCCRCRKFSARSSEFVLVSAWILAVTLIVIPTFSPHAQVLLVPAYLLICRYRRAIWRKGKWPGMLAVVACALPLWESLAAVSMTAAMAIVPKSVLQGFWLIALYPSPILPSGVVLLFAYLLVRGPNLSVEHV